MIMCRFYTVLVRDHGCQSVAFPHTSSKLKLNSSTRFKVWYQDLMFQDSVFEWSQELYILYKETQYCIQEECEDICYNHLE